jgi:hypothetical protein
MLFKKTEAKVEDSKDKVECMVGIAINASQEAIETIQEQMVEAMIKTGQEQMRA